MSGINVLPVLMAVVTFMNQKFLMPPPAVQTKEQEQQRKMMVYTSLLFPLMFYAVPSGLNLYYLTSTGLGIGESWLIRKHIKEREAMEKAGKEFVEVGKATRANRSKKYESAPVEKKRGIGAWFADLQAKAEEMRRQGPPSKRKN
jgi:membrane protein insertase Oxa1/YidC/SpoIIIJ